jgi:CubicO group peptidase (beta-lactamase class C family)
MTDRPQTPLQKQYSRRDVLKVAATAMAVASFPVVGAAPGNSAPAVGGGKEGIDQALRQAADAQEVPGVVAMAATDKGTLYEAAFGKRDLSKGPDMTLDTVFWIASMTKAVTAAAAMQLVEQGKLQLEQPMGTLLPELASPQVLEGFDDKGAPRLRPARRPITLRHLLTHTAGFAYDVWDAPIGRYMQYAGIPRISTCRNDALRVPLVFDPGERWEYGINIDWAGKAVEAVSGQTLDAYFREHIFTPLGMTDTGFILTPGQRSRLVALHQRKADGALEPVQFEMPQNPEFFMGGGGLYSTARDYLAFEQMLLHGGRFNGAQVLRPETVALMSQNHIGDLHAGILKTAMPMASNDVDFFPGMDQKWGLSFLINTQPGPAGRSAGSLAWAGAANTYFWIDPTKRVAGVILMQLRPFADDKAVRLYGQFESGVYKALQAA